MSQSEGRRSPARRLAFAGIALLIPVLFFALVEFALRAAGQRTVYPLFVSSPNQPQYLQANPEVIKRFFSDPAAAPPVNIETSYFLKDRPPGGLRVVVQGGSSAAGFPYGYGASIAGMLEQRLRRLITDRPVEVVTTAMSAVNSYTLLDFADEIIAVRPDAVLIYAGHNEYLGVLGVGSALSSDLSPSLTRWTLRLRRFALYQAIERLVGGIGSPPPLDEASAGGTLMARIAREKAIPFESPDYRQGLEQFAGNLERLLRKYRRAGIPVIVGTLASNEKDRAPFVSELAPDTDAAAFAAAFARGVAALDAGEYGQAEAQFAAALALDDGAANAWFARARAAYGREDFAAALTAYHAARDRDQLRFRAPAAFNGVVREVAKRQGAAVADVQGALAQASPQGIVGQSLMLEHVHPNLDGYFLMADAYFDALFATGVLVAHGQLADDAQARREIPVSEVDRLFGEYKLLRVINDWPFRPQRQEPEIPAPGNDIENLAYQMYQRRLGWPQAMVALREHYLQQGDAERALHTAQILADALPFVPGPQYHAGTGLIRAGRAPEALRYLRRAAAGAPNDTNVLLAFAHALVLNGRREDARAPLQRVLELDPSNATARDALAQLRGPGKD